MSACNRHLTEHLDLVKNELISHITTISSQLKEEARSQFKEVHDRCTKIETDISSVKTHLDIDEKDAELSKLKSEFQSLQNQNKALSDQNKASSDRTVPRYARDS